MTEQFTLQQITDEKDWQPLLVNETTPFTQSFEYGMWQDALHRTVKRFVVFEGNSPKAFFQIIFYPLIAEKKYGYVPYGPVASGWTQELLIFIKEKIKEISKKENAVFVRLDFTPILTDTFQTLFTKPKLFSYIGSYFQPRYEWLLSLEKGEEEIMANMHQKGRYSVRLAEKKGVQVEIVEKDFQAHLSVFYKLMSDTAKRNGFSLHERKYYEAIFESVEGKGNAYLVIAKYEEEILAMDFVFMYGKTAMYVFGGSSGTHRELSAPHLAQWRSLCHAKKLGMRFYNFGGIEDPERILHKDWEGITSFKQKFGGFVLKHSDFYDVVSNRLLYFLYTVRKQIKSR